MKLDADVNLSQDYFFELFKNANSESAILGGVLTGISREQQDYVPGPVKMYSIEGFIAISDLPSAPGFDVMDEVLCEFKQLTVTVVKSARFSLNRPIGHSQGKLHGRYRNGRICRWTGYAPEYFALHLLRYIFRKPYVFGSLFMFFGFMISMYFKLKSKLYAV
jgi:hypothetical protein